MKRKLLIFTVSLLSIAVVALTAAVWLQSQRADEYERKLTADRNRAFYELVISISEIDAALQKTLYCTSPVIAGAISAEIYGKALSAQISLARMPRSAAGLEQTAAFISKTGDYAYSIARSCAAGSFNSGELVDNLRPMAKAASHLASGLASIYEKNGGNFTDDIFTFPVNVPEDEEMPDPSLGASISGVERELPELPNLIYDGLFSGHIGDMNPRLLEGQALISKNEARKAAAAFLGIGEGRVYLTGESKGDIPAYHFETGIDGGTVSVQISKTGGKVLSLLSSRDAGAAVISTDDARRIAAQFLIRHGFEDMCESHFVIDGNVLEINYAYNQGGVICYSDNIKLGIALDTGTIYSFESRAYIMSHGQREITEPVFSADTAREGLPQGLEIISEELALIPTCGKNELLCHEFKCLAENGQSLIIYINASTGEQEKIMLVLEGENGALVV